MAPNLQKCNVITILEGVAQLSSPIMTEAVNLEPLGSASNLLVELQAKLDAISRSQVVIEFDLDGAVIFANDKFLDAFGYSVGEVVGRHHSFFVDVETIQSLEYVEFWERLRRGEYHSGEYKRLGKYNREIWIQATYNPILDIEGRPYKVIKYAVDVTQAKLENADFSGQIAAISKSQAVVEFDLSGCVITANENFLELVGYSLGEILGRHHRMFVDPQAVRCPEYEKFWCDLRAGHYCAGEYRRIGRDGQEIWLNASYNPIRDLNGKPFKIVKYAADVTEAVLRKQLLKTSREVAEAAAASKSAFLANMSHELRTPLTSILGFARLVGRSETLSGQDRKHLELISSAGESLMSVINDILDFSKLEAGAMTLSLRPFSPANLLDEVCQILGQQAREKSLVLTFECDTGVVLVGDGSRFRQVLLNLVNNAIKFTNDGGINITAKADALSGGLFGLEIEVKDTGIGLAPDAALRLFNRFVQVDDSASRRFGGTGLGLAICREIVEFMGGEIGVTSKEGEGSTFWFKVALPESDAVETPELEGMLATFEHPIRILFADDHIANRTLVSAIFEPFDIVLDTVENGMAAVEAAAGQVPYDLILMDMQMPVMDGPTAARAIRRLAAPNRDTPIVALTANILPEQIETCLLAGMQGHLAKPIEFEALIGTVKRFCLFDEAREHAI